MAHRKRSRDVNDIDGDVEVESASSSFRQGPSSKRSRVALARENGGSVVSDDDDDERIDADPTSTHLPSSYSEDEDDEIDEIRATQVYHKSLRREHKENVAMEHGVIEEVYCRNFMCHSKLRIKLGPLINFIIGHNGSGKSAVLTALTMCLGGKAITTNRGASLKSLIKEGEESATLAVKIKNRGEGAYKPELYGSSITVERNFTRAGSSGFKLKNASEKVISTKKGDLDDILDFFAFQLDNPINVLTQDMARQFLSNSSPSDKYRFFIRGTQLEILDADYKLLEEHLDSMNAKLNSREQDIAALKRREEEAEAKKKRIEQTSSIRQKINKLQWEHAWAQVEEQEKVRDEHNVKVEAAERSIEEATEAAENVGDAYEGHDQAHQAATRAQSNFQEQLEPARENHQAQMDKFDANKKDLLNHQSQERDIRGQMTACRKMIKKFESDIKVETDRLADSGSAQHAERLAQLDELNAAVENVKRQQMDHGTGFAPLERRKKETLEELDGAKAGLAQHRHTLDRAKERLQTSINEQPRPFAGYRNNMANLVREVGRETRWRVKPVGPMGAHVKLLKMEWSSQIEKTFGGVLESFVVFCKDDQMIMSQIMKRTNCEVGIYIGDAEPLNTAGKEPHDVDTIMRVLEIDNHAVRNQLIINQAIDQTVLIANFDEAYTYMNSGNRPQFVKATICQTPHDARKGTRLEFTRSGNAKSSPVARWDGPLRMKSNREEQIQAQRDEVNQAARDLDTAEQANRQLVKAHEDAKKELVRFQRRQNEFKTEIQQAEDAVESKQAEIDEHRPEDGRLEAMQQGMEEAKAQLETAEASGANLVNHKDDLDEKARELKAAVAQAKLEMDQATQRLEDARERVHRTGLARQEALHEKNLALAMIDAAKKERDRLKTTADEHAAMLQTEFVERAEEICARIPVTESSAVIDQCIDKLIQDQKRAEREAGGTREEILTAYQEARKEHQDAKYQLKNMMQIANTLQQTLTNRNYRWRMFRKYISLRASVQFGYLLSERQFRGRLLMNHQDKELDIKVEPDLSKASDAGRATKTLSGGEKSFSTICLLLAIWEAMGSPIRCLDEFDVFMDSVNRATSMSMMITAARRSIGRQFILITPQSMNNVELGDDVKIHKMSDPERGQTTLPFVATQG